MDNEKKTLNEEEMEKTTGGYGYNGYVNYTVVSRDTLSGLAVRFRTTIGEIMRLNPIIKNADLIRVGWVLTIPDNR